MSTENIRITLATLNLLIIRGEKHNKDTIRMFVDAQFELAVLDNKLKEYRRALDDLMPVIDRNKHAWVYELLDKE
jgi:TPP-dependent trihydroxycyclohexane-1,2-dione (THcHDO) dehydratase